MPCSPSRSRVSAHPFSSGVAALSEQPVVPARRRLDVCQHGRVEQRVDRRRHIEVRVPAVGDQDDAVGGAVVPDLVLRIQPSERSKGAHHTQHRPAGVPGHVSTVGAVKWTRCARVAAARDLANAPQMNRQRRGTCPPPTASPRCRRGCGSHRGRRAQGARVAEGWRARSGLGEGEGGLGGKVS